jgi:hypothetical protein
LLSAEHLLSLVVFCLCDNLNRLLESSSDFFLPVCGVAPVVVDVDEEPFVLKSNDCCVHRTSDKSAKLISSTGGTLLILPSSGFVVPLSLSCALLELLLLLLLLKML